MLSYFTIPEGICYAIAHTAPFSKEQEERLRWLFGMDNNSVVTPQVKGDFIGPKSEMVSPWSTNAVEIAHNMGISSVTRIERLRPCREAEAKFDPMLERKYTDLGEHLFDAVRLKEEIKEITDIAAYNKEEGLALSEEEIAYLNNLSKQIGRPLTDSELFGFSQVNSEHCRHKIFNGRFILNGKEMPHSLFSMIKETSKRNPNRLVSAYKDNVAFVEGFPYRQFAPEDAANPALYAETPNESVLSLKAETHNFPTTVEPFNGAATGSGGEIRDRMAGGMGSLPMAGTAVYMTAYPRTNNDAPVSPLRERNYLYQSPSEILIKASNGASDFGNKFGQPLICGSLLTFEHTEPKLPYRYAYDKVIMLAGGIGYAKQRDAVKGKAQPGQSVVVMGGDNYRIGMGGGAVSSVDTGAYSTGIELNAVQRANPEMQKRVLNVVRSLTESEENPIISIHDHGAGGHLNCLTELIEESGGKIDIDTLPVGDPTLSDREIIGNESQERMGLLIEKKDYDRIKRIADREKAPIFAVGETNDSHELLFAREEGKAALNLPVDALLASPPVTVMKDSTLPIHFANPEAQKDSPFAALDRVLSLEAVACKDWLTNKVDRSVTGRVARQQCVGVHQLPLSDLGAISLDYGGKRGIATSLGHAPQIGLISASCGAVCSIAEALTNIVFAPLEEGLRSVSLSANWMWPSRNKGEDCRLYEAVEAAGAFASALGINIPTGKDSLSMTQQYPNGEMILSPGTLIISAMGAVSDVQQIVTPELSTEPNATLLYIDFSHAPLALGGSAYYQSRGFVGSDAPTVADSDYFAKAFDTVQKLIRTDKVLAGHDVSAGGLLVTLMEMAFTLPEGGIDISLESFGSEDIFKVCYAENPAVVLQVRNEKEVLSVLDAAGIRYHVLNGQYVKESTAVRFHYDGTETAIDIDKSRKTWAKSSYCLDKLQTETSDAESRYALMGKRPLHLVVPKHFSGTMPHVSPSAKPITAAVLRDKGTNGERELAWAFYKAGFAVKDVHLSDLIEGRESLEDVSMLAFAGGFSNSDVLGSAKGWAAGILYNEKARRAIEDFYKRENTLSMGVCNGCQLMSELGVLSADGRPTHHMRPNHSGKFESCFVNLTIPETNSVMFSSLVGSTLGVWCAHGEGRFEFDNPLDTYHVAARYTHNEYPYNPNGSPEGIAALTSADGRHLAIMPHPERSIYPQQCGFYPRDRRTDAVTPWMEAFANAYRWLAQRR